MSRVNLTINVSAARQRTQDAGWDESKRKWNNAR